MSDAEAAVRGLMADIERAESAFDTVSARLAEQTEARVREAQREREARERAERATAVLREEREVIRDALRTVAGSGDSAAEDGAR